jgi:hypothetical protein
MSDDPNTPPSAEDVSHFPPEMAAERLVALSAAYNKTQPPKAVHELSPEEANSRLAAMTEAFNKTKPTTLPEADAAVLGDDRLPRESEVTTWPKQSIRNKLSTVDMLRDVGIPDPGIARVISGEPYSKEDYDAAIAWRTRTERDPEFRAKLFAGDPAARHVLTAMSVIISMGPAEAK